MAQIREVKKRIKSIENTKKVTHAMELVATTKMRKAQLAALAGRPYSTSLEEIIAEVRIKSGKAKHTLLEEKQALNQIIILISSDRGLAGGLNINLFREILKSEVKNPQLISVGKKAANFVVKSGYEILAQFQSEEKSSLDLARTLSKMAIDAFKKSQTSRISLLYPHFESTIKQTPKWIQLLPIELKKLDLQAPSNQKVERLLLEPSADIILGSILPHHIITQIYQVLLEAKAAEHSARMVAMKNATDAAGELIEDLTLTYNQARQEAITKELLDIITAKRAFE